MSRPRYESAADRDAETKVMDYCYNRIGDYHAYHKLPISYELDYALIDSSGAIGAYAEVKCRKNARFPLMISLSKILAGHKLHGTGAEVFYIWRAALPGQDRPTLNCWAFNGYQFDTKCKVVWGGRTVQTRDSADIEPVVLIPEDVVFDIEKYC